MIKTFLCLFTLLTLFSCSSSFKPQQGDLLFQDLDCGSDCEAIELVTSGIENTNLSHIGMIYIENNQTFVLEAIPPKVKLTPLKEFLGRSEDAHGKPKVMVGRIYSKDVKFLKRALKQAKARIGMPYDDLFLYNNGKYYCSELIYDVFKRANYNKPFFDLKPMTFKAPGDSRFLPSWIAYYDKIHAPIPEGELGINPAGISHSDHLKIIHHYGELSKK